MDVVPEENVVVVGYSGRRNQVGSSSSPVEERGCRKSMQASRKKQESKQVCGEVKQSSVMGGGRS